jgi:hypothetical protein
MQAPQDSSTPGHLDFNYFQSLIKNERSQSQIDQSQTHLKECDRCRELSEVFVHARSVAASQAKLAVTAHPQKSELMEIVEKLMSDEGSPREAAIVVSHVVSCSRCFKSLEMFFEEALSPLPKTVEQDLEIYSKVSIAENVLQLRPPLANNAQPSIKKNRLALPSFLRFENFRLPQVAYALLAITIIGGVTIWRILQNPTSTLDAIVATRIPVEYTESGFRGSDDPRPETLQLFLAQFKFAIGDYLTQNYENAIKTFDAMKPAADALLAASPNLEELNHIRDYYFYAGIAHLAISRSEDEDPHRSAAADHRRKACEYLLSAQMIASQNNLASLDREIFFLGLAYGFDGKPELARPELKRIPAHSDYFADSQKLIREWSE